MQSNIRSLVFTALFAALFIVLSMQQMRLTVTPVPITFQTFAVILSGIFLKPRYAFMSIFIVILLSAFGLPLFGGKGGIPHLIGPTGGFIAAFPFCAMFISMAIDKWLTMESRNSRKIMTFIGLFIIFELFSSLFAYLLGIPWLMHAVSYSFPKALSSGFIPFIPGDAIKALLGAAVAFALTPYILHIRQSAVSRTSNEADVSA